MKTAQKSLKLSPLDNDGVLVDSNFDAAVKIEGKQVVKALDRFVTAVERCGFVTAGASFSGLRFVEQDPESWAYDYFGRQYRIPNLSRIGFISCTPDAGACRKFAKLQELASFMWNRYPFPGTLVSLTKVNSTANYSHFLKGTQVKQKFGWPVMFFDMNNISLSILDLILLHRSHNTDLLFSFPFHDKLVSKDFSNKTTLHHFQSSQVEIIEQAHDSYEWQYNILKTLQTDQDPIFQAKTSLGSLYSLTHADGWVNATVSDMTAGINLLLDQAVQDVKTALTIFSAERITSILVAGELSGE